MRRVSLDKDLIKVYEVHSNTQLATNLVYSGRQMNLLSLRKSAANRGNPPVPPPSQDDDGTATDLAGDAALGSTQLCTVVDECCMLRSNSSKLMACPMLRDGNLPAEACARSSGENQRAS